tara:strand:+ start:243 stop:473 length:231 start_codon:yes stop_codon:yes gene_type:complete
MIKCRSEIPNRKIEIDLSSEKGNAFYLISLVDSLGRQLGIDKKIRKDIKTTMMLGSYDDLLKTFDIWFGNIVILYR